MSSAVGYAELTVITIFYIAARLEPVYTVFIFQVNIQMIFGTFGSSYANKPVIYSVIFEYTVILLVDYLIGIACRSA